MHTFFFLDNDLKSKVKSRKKKRHETNISICFITFLHHFIRACECIYIYIKSERPGFSDRIKFVVAVPVLLYGCTTWTRTKRREKKPDWNCTRNLHAVLDNSWKQPLQNSSYTATFFPSHKPCKLDEQNFWWSKEELISNVLVWTPTYGYISVGWQAKTYIDQLCADTGYCQEDFPVAMPNRNACWGRGKGIRAINTSWFTYINIA